MLDHCASGQRVAEHHDIDPVSKVESVLDLYADLNGVLQKLPTYKVIQIKRLA